MEVSPLSAPSQYSHSKYNFVTEWFLVLYGFLAPEWVNLVSSLPLAVRFYLTCQLDRDNHANVDLKEIANHMEKWDSNLASHLKLTEADTNEINRKFNVDPALQR